MTTISDIQQAVADHYGLPIGLMTSPQRARSQSWPRMVAMHLCQELTVATIADIGRAFSKHYSTTFHGIEKAKWLIHKMPSLAKDVQIIRARLEKNGVAALPFKV